MASSKSRRRGHSDSLGELRIISGRWRGRKLTFPATEGLRPTTDRVRETLFNWLAPDITGARCVDLFAGSGALGLEALSRGAAYCNFVDASPEAVRQISAHLERLDARQLGTAHRGLASEYLDRSDAPLDVVFIDPPFAQDLILPTCKQLASSALLAPRALVYVESPAQEALTNMPSDWSLHRERIAGAVAYRLYRLNPA